MKRLLLAFLLGLTTACTIIVPPVVTPPTPTPPVPPAPVVKMGALDISTNPRLGGLTILIDGQPFTAAPEPNCLKIDDTGAGFCSNVPTGPHTVAIDGLPAGIESGSPAIIAVEPNVTLSIVFNLQIIQPPPPPPGLLRALHVDGLGFVEDNHPWIYRGFTDFLLYQKFLAGEDLTPLLHERVALGANVVRVLGMVSSFSHFYPQEHGDYYDRLAPFADTLAGNGLRVEFVVFADAQIIMPVGSDEEAHLDRVVAALQSKPNVLIEVCNEPFKNLPGGGDAATALARRISGHGLLVATGNYDLNTVGSELTLYAADYVTFHPERKPEWPRTAKDAQDLRDGWAGGATPGFVGFHKPVLSDEPMGAADTDSDSRSAQSDDFAYFGATSALMGAGGTFHSDGGILSQLLSPAQKQSALAFFTAQRWVPTIAQFSPYQRGDANGGPGVGNMPLEHTDALALRTFCKFANGDEYCVVIRPAAGWTATARDGWHILDQSGPHGALVHLGR